MKQGAIRYYLIAPCFSAAAQRSRITHRRATLCASVIVTLHMLLHTRTLLCLPILRPLRAPVRQYSAGARLVRAAVDAQLVVGALAVAIALAAAATWSVNIRKCTERWSAGVCRVAHLRCACTNSWPSCKACMCHQYTCTLASTASQQVASCARTIMHMYTNVCTCSQVRIRVFNLTYSISMQHMRSLMVNCHVPERFCRVTTRSRARHRLAQRPARGDRPRRSWPGRRHRCGQARAQGRVQEAVYAFQKRQARDHSICQGRQGDHSCCSAGASER
jgi:hypothetical protein